MSHLISERAASRKFSHFSRTAPEGAPEGFKPHPKLLPLHWGMPNNGFFPVESIDINVVKEPFQHLTTKPEDVEAATNKITISRFATSKDLIGISDGLQYGEIDGFKQLLQFTREFITRVHPPGYDDWSTVITNGAGDGLNKAADALLDPEDVVLLEEFTFVPFLQNIKNAGAIPVPIKLNISANSEGLDLDYLTNLLENWETLKPGLRKPKALYTIATGQNPTGLTQSLEFRKKVYALAEKYDFAIIEDDPYGYLVLPPFQKPDLPVQAVESNDEYVKNHIVPSYLTLDTVGRVLRIETFSKLFAPGLRLGYIVAHKKVVDVIKNYAAVVTRSSSGTSQALVQNVIEQQFGGIEGWLEWIIKLRSAYARRRNVLFDTIYESKAYEKKYLNPIDPKAGMFLSLLLNFPEGTDIPAKIALLNWKFLEYGVGVVPGLNMAVDKEFSEKNGNFLRLTFAPSNNDEEIREAATRLTDAVYDFFEKGLEF